mgnify:CR=1 FL=1
MSNTVSQIIVAISAAIILKNVWALVFGCMAGHLVSLIMSYIIHPYKPKLKINTKIVKELLNFGKWVWCNNCNNIITFIALQGDDIFVGKFLGSISLGLYQVAFKFSNIMASEITHVIGRVTFPAYAKLQNNVVKLREASLQTIEIVSCLSFPLASGILSLGHDFVYIFLGKKWIPMVPILHILTISGLVALFREQVGHYFTL